MKSSELMIGDFVSVVPSGLPIKIAAVHNKKVGYHSRVTRLEWVRLSLLSPIPLTPEILEKNGLEKDNHGRLFGECFDEDDSRDLEITLDDRTGVIWWSYNWDEYRIIKLSYVHELQHALRLCNIDKEIVL